MFLPTLLTSSLNLHTHVQSTYITLLALLIYLLALPIGGMLADRIGVLRQIKIASMLYLMFSYVIFSVVPRLSISGCIGVFVFFAIIQALLNSALPAFMVTQFQQNQRGKALAISYNMGLSLLAGLMPYIILTSKKYLNPGIPMTICAALSLVILYFKGGKNGHL